MKIKTFNNGKCLRYCRKSTPNLPAKSEICLKRNIFPIPSDSVFTGITGVCTSRWSRINLVLAGEDGKVPGQGRRDGPFQFRKKTKAGSLTDASCQWINAETPLPGNVHLNSLLLEYHPADIHNLLRILAGCEAQSSLYASKQVDTIEADEQTGNRRTPQGPAGTTFCFNFLFP